MLERCQHFGKQCQSIAGNGGFADGPITLLVGIPRSFLSTPTCAPGEVTMVRSFLELILKNTESPAEELHLVFYYVV